MQKNLLNIPDTVECRLVHVSQFAYSSKIHILKRVSANSLICHQFRVQLMESKNITFSKFQYVMEISIQVYF